MQEVDEDEAANMKNFLRNLNLGSSVQSGLVIDSIHDANLLGSMSLASQEHVSGDNVQHTAEDDRGSR